MDDKLVTVTPPTRDAPEGLVWNEIIALHLAVIVDIHSNDPARKFALTSPNHTTPFPGAYNDDQLSHRRRLVAVVHFEAFQADVNE